MRRVAIPFALVTAVVLGGAGGFPQASPVPARADKADTAPTAPAAPTTPTATEAPTDTPTASPTAAPGSNPPPILALPGRVGMTLLYQSPWNSPSQLLQVKVRVANPTATALTGVTVTLTIGFPATSRTVYEESLRDDPTGSLFTTTFTEEGPVPAGGTRAFVIRQRLDSVPGLSGPSALYPLRIDLRADDQIQATMRTPMVYLAQPPAVPLNLSWTFVLSEPLQVGPEGVFETGPIESDIAPRGRIARIVAALDRPVPPAVDVAVSPVLLDELRAMADGYRIRRAGGSIQVVQQGSAGAKDAADLLGRLTHLAHAPQTEIVAQPFGDVSLPAVQRAGFDNVASLIERGREDVATTLSTTPADGIFRPPGSALDAASFLDLTDEGFSTLLLDPEFVPTQPDLPFSPPCLGAVISGRRSATAVLPDGGVAALASTYPADAMLGAHAVLGEMAARWLEFPNASERWVAMLAKDVPAAPVGLYPALVSLVTGAPWLHPQRVSSFVKQSPPAVTPTLPAHRFPTFSSDYLDRLRAARASLSQFTTSATGAHVADVERTLGKDLLIAESGTFVTSPSLGLQYIAAVDGPRGIIRRTYAAVVPPPDGGIHTLTSRNGYLPFTITNGSRFALRVRVSLTSDRRLIFDPSSLRTTLSPNAPFPHTWRVDAATTGRFLTRVRITTPGGRLIASSTVVIRSTAYDRVALVVTIGAGLFLALWWGRGVLRRRRA